MFEKKTTTFLGPLYVGGGGGEVWLNSAYLALAKKPDWEIWKTISNHCPKVALQPVAYVISKAGQSSVHFFCK